MALKWCLCLPLVYFVVSRTQGAPDGKCVYNGTVYLPGDKFPALDGCNNCTCHYSFVACTRCLCLPLEVGKRFLSSSGISSISSSSSSSSSNNNNNNNNNNNVNINYNTVITSTVVTISHAVTCTVNSVTYPLTQGYTGTDGCTVCRCTQTGMACSSLACPSHTPVQTDFHKCQYGGRQHNYGDWMQHTDGCNTCICGMNSIQCTDAAACKPTTPAYDCTYDGNGYMSGQSFPSRDGCNLCQCTILGVICTSNTCTTTTTTTTMAPYTCEWFGKFYHDGDVMPGDGCHTCTCKAGKAECSATMNCPIATP